MKKADVQIGHVYPAKVSGKVVQVQILNLSTHGGWDVRNLRTLRTIHVKTAARLRG